MTDFDYSWSLLMWAPALMPKANSCGEYTLVSPVLSSKYCTTRTAYEPDMNYLFGY